MKSLEDTFGLSGRSFVVTGASSGLGRTMALYLAHAGAAVVLVARRQTELEELTAQIQQPGGQASYVVADLCQRENLGEIAQQCQESIAGREVDGVVNAAGVTRQTGISSVRSGGIVVHIGLMDNKGEMDVRALTLREITFIGTYTYTPVDLRVTLQKLYSGALGSLEWLEQRPMALGADAFHDLNKGLCAAPKIVLNAGS